jgi:PIN domain nuclease of toxin-antitoxin system
MIYLLDTCVLIWLGLEPASIPLKIRKIIDNADNEFFVSAISAWEIAQKEQRGGLILPRPSHDWFDQICEYHDISVLVLGSKEGLRAGALPPHHGDPADRMIIATALEHGLTVLTPDKKFKLYSDLKLVG